MTIHQHHVPQRGPSVRPTRFGTAPTTCGSDGGTSGLHPRIKAKDTGHEQLEGEPVHV